MTNFHEADVKFKIIVDLLGDGRKVALTVHQVAVYYYVLLPDRTTIKLSYEFTKVPPWRQLFGKLPQGTIDRIGDGIKNLKG